MKHLHLALLLVFSFILASCSNSNNSNDNNSAEKEKKSNLFAKKLTVVGTGEEKKRTEDVSKIKSDYFEISLSLLSDSDMYIATRDLEKPSSMENFRMVVLTITNKEGEDIKFKGTTEFLNFMSEKGYEMVDQEKSKYSTSYTFKKKD